MAKYLITSVKKIMTSSPSFGFAHFTFFLLSGNSGQSWHLDPNFGFNHKHLTIRHGRKNLGNHSGGLHSRSLKEHHPNTLGIIPEIFGKVFSLLVYFYFSLKFNKNMWGKWREFPPKGLGLMPEEFG